MSSQRARIAALAYRLWEQRGRPADSSETDWYEAERQLQGELNDATQSKATLDPLAQGAADGRTTTAPPDGPVPKRSRNGRNGGRQSRDNGVETP
jgi:hypothetical protein